MIAVNNKYPCCNKHTGLRLDLYADGQVIHRRCPMCKQAWQITFSMSDPWPGKVQPCMKLTFEKELEHAA